MHPCVMTPLWFQLFHLGFFSSLCESYRSTWSENLKELGPIRRVHVLASVQTKMVLQLISDRSCVTGRESFFLPREVLPSLPTNPLPVSALKQWCKLAPLPGKLYTLSLPSLKSELAVGTDVYSYRKLCT